MNSQTFRLRLILTTSGFALVLFGILAVMLTGNQAASAAVKASETQAGAREIAARRAISIPYGISSVLTMTADGSQIAATGHAVCWDEGQMFDLNVRIAQISTQAFAEGRSIDICAGGERQDWDAEARTAGQAAFELGPARACAEALEFALHGVADEYHWCKDVVLTGVASGTD